MKHGTCSTKFHERIKLIYYYKAKRAGYPARLNIAFVCAIYRVRYA